MTVHEDKAGQARAVAEYKPIGPAKRAQFQHLQALDDAIEFRQARAAAACPDCGPDDESRCDEHACDLALVAAYGRTASEIIGCLKAEIRASRPVSAER